MDLLEDSSSDGDIGGEWALLINVNSLDGSLWGLEAKTDLFVVSRSRGSLFGEGFLGVLEDSNLLLISFFGLYSQEKKSQNLDVYLNFGTSRHPSEMGCFWLILLT